MKAGHNPPLEINIDRERDRKEPGQDQDQDYSSSQRLALLLFGVEHQSENPVRAQLDGKLEDDANPDDDQERKNERDRKSVGRHSRFAQGFRRLECAHQSLRRQDEAEPSNAGDHQSMRLAAEQSSPDEEKATALEGRAQN